MAVFVLPAQVGVAMAIAHFIASEALNMIGPMMLVEMLAAMWIIAVPSVVAIISVINVPPEAFAAAIPRPCTDEDTARKPFRPVVAVRGAIIGRIVEITVRAFGGRSDLYRYLSVCLLR